MEVIESIKELRDARGAMRGTVGLVPTMGFLHEGHLSLIKEAHKDNDKVIATIFVNPTQFNANEDLSTYPRDLPHDLAMLESANVDLVFTPSPAEMYPHGFQTYVTVEQVSQGLEGAERQGHFRGVATVVAKLFNLAQADFAYFGQKDAQQAVVIRQMARDLNFPTQIAICPIVRESDGLAMSSRNVYLNAEERQAATVLYRAIQAVGQIYIKGEHNPTALRNVAREVIEAEPLAHLSYVSLADAQTLQELHEATDTPLLLSLAAQVGKPRLIDNCLLPLTFNNRKFASQVLGME